MRTILCGTSSGGAKERERGEAEAPAELQRVLKLLERQGMTINTDEKRGHRKSQAQVPLDGLDVFYVKESGWEMGVAIVSPKDFSEFVEAGEGFVPLVGIGRGVSFKQPQLPSDRKRPNIVFHYYKDEKRGLEGLRHMMIENSHIGWKQDPEKQGERILWSGPIHQHYDYCSVLPVSDGERWFQERLIEIKPETLVVCTAGLSVKDVVDQNGEPAEVFLMEREAPVTSLSSLGKTL